MSVFKIGIYGKLPAHPDFISSEVEASVTSELYEWAQRVIHDSQNDLGDDWLSAYLVSPLWRFLLPASPQRKTGLVGVMTPSVDAVGRYFPLFLFIEIELTRVRSAWLFQEISPLLKLLEETAILSLQKRLDIKQLKEHIAEKSIGFEPGKLLRSLHRCSIFSPWLIHYLSYNWKNWNIHCGGHLWRSEISVNPAVCLIICRASVNTASC